MYEQFEKLCEERGVTAYKVAKATGISTATLSNWKAGRSTPKTDKLQLIADYFDVPLETFTDKKKRIVAKFDTKGLLKNATTQFNNVLYDKDELAQRILKAVDGSFSSGKSVYYQNEETARLAQEMFEDKDMRALFHMKQTMEPEKFAAHMKMMREMYRLDHPEEFPEDFE